MKKVTTLLVAAAIACAPVLANTGKKSAKEATSSVSLKRTGTQQFDFRLISAVPGKVEVKIYSEKGKLLHENQYSYKKSFKVPFDLSNLEQGNYRFVIEGAGIEKSQEVFVSKLEEEDVAAFFQPLEDDKVKVTIYHDNVPVKITLLDKDGNRYYQNTLSGEKNFAQLFDLSDVHSKELEMIVKGKKSTIVKIL